jgi:hypothetical protein
MRTRRKVLVVLVCFVALVGLLPFLSRINEPRYQGHPLSYWVLRDDVYHERSGEKREAEQAICQIGTNAFPFLLKWIQHEDPSWRWPAINLARSIGGRLPRWVTANGWTIANRIEDSTSDKLACNADEALRSLGEQATPIIPELMALLTNGTPDLTAISASAILGFIGTNAMPALTAAIEDPFFNEHHGLVLAAICNTHPSLAAAAAVVPVLIHCLNETNIPHMAAAAETLGTLRAEPHLAVPALIGCLKNNDRGLRFACVHALAEFGTNAQPAIPALVHCLHDPSAEVENAAAITLGRIGLEPGLVIPALANATQNSAADISAVRALAMFASQATNELPLLTNLLSHPTWQVRIQATNAIRSITASALTNTLPR